MAKYKKKNKHTCENNQALIIKGKRNKAITRIIRRKNPKKNNKVGNGRP